MILATTNVLGLALSDRSITCAEIGGKSDHVTVKQAAIFTFPPDVSFDKPDALGQALASFIKQKGFSSSHAVIGVPAKWLMAVDKEVPPANRDQMRAMLRMQAERLPLAESGEVIFDFAGEHLANKPGRVLLVAILKKQLDRVTKLAESAGLSIAAITSTSLALSNVAIDAGKGNAEAPMVALGRHGAEVVWQQGGSPRMLRHFSLSTTNGHGAPALGPLGTELRRAVTLLPTVTANGRPAGKGGGELMLWDGVGLDDSQMAELSDKLGLKLRSDRDLSMLGIRMPQRTPGAVDTENSPQRLAPAVALAIVGADRNLMPFNFVKSRLAPPPVRRIGRKGAWAIAIGALVVVGIAALFIDVNLREKDLADLQAQRESISKDFLSAQAIKDKADFSNAYLKDRVRNLDCLRDVWGIFGTDSNIWATSFKFNEDREGKDLNRLDAQIDGKTANPASVNQLVQRLIQTPKKFSKVVAGGIGGASAQQRNREVSNTFTVKFTYDATPPGSAQ